MTTENSGPSSLETEIIASLGKLPPDVLASMKELPAKFLCRMCEISPQALDALSRLPIDVLQQMTDMSAPTLEWLGSVADSVDELNGDALIRFARMALDSPEGMDQIKSMADDTLQILLSLPVEVVNNLMALPPALLQELPEILRSVGDTLDEVPESLAQTLDEVPTDLMATLDELNPEVVATLCDVDPSAFATLAEVDPAVLNTLSELPAEVVASLAQIPPGVLSTVLELPGEAVDAISKIDPRVLERTAQTKPEPVVPRQLYLKIGEIEDGSGKAWNRMVSQARSLAEIQAGELAPEEFGSPEEFAGPAAQSDAASSVESIDDPEGDTDPGEGADDNDDSYGETVQSEDWSGEGLSAFDDESAEAGMGTADFSQVIDPEGLSAAINEEDSRQTLPEQKSAFDGGSDDESYGETVQSDDGWSDEGLSIFDQESESASSAPANDDDDSGFGETIQSDDFEGRQTLVDGPEDDDSYGETVQSDSFDGVAIHDDSFDQTVQSDEYVSDGGDDDDDSYGETVQSDSMAFGTVSGETFDDDEVSYDQTVQSDSMSLEPNYDDDESYAQTVQSDSMSLDASDDDDSYGQTMISDDSFQTAQVPDDDSYAQTVQSTDLDSGMTAALDDSDGDASFAQTLATSNLSPQDQRTMADAWGNDFDKGVRPGMTIKSERKEVKGPDSKQTLVISTRKLGTRNIPDYNKGRRPPEPREPEYELLKVLGEGGMGVVFEARQRSIDREVALKMLKPKTAKDKEQRAKFLTEAVVTGELDHPNIVPIYDVGASPDDALFYSMKKVQGTPWLKVIKEKSCTENLDILMRSCDAVAFAHARGVIHRDLKPENIMLGGFGEVLVMDWGLAYSTEEFRKSQSITENTSMGGTPAYMAPEMATGPISKIGEHSDVYLFGAMLFEIVTGKPPHAGKNAMKCLMAAARNTIRKPDEEKLAVNDPTGELLEIAMKAMKTEIPERTSTVKEFQAQIREYQKHTDSVSLSARAIEDLKVAKKTDDYQDFSRALFGFQEAYAMWNGNDAAKEGIEETKLAYALSAERKGDYNQGMTLLDVGIPEHKEIYARMKEANDEREARQARLQRMKRIGMVAAGVFLFVISGAAIWINSERTKAIAAEQEAIKQKDKAVIAEKEAVKQKDIALLAKKATEKALVQVEKEKKNVEAQKVIAEENAAEARRQEKIAKAEERKAKEARAKAEMAQMEEAKQRKLAEAATAAAVKAQKEAVKARDDAIKAQKAEEIAKVAAVKAKDEAIKAKEEEEKAKVAAVKAKDDAVKARMKAEEEEKKAIAARKEEEKAKIAAVEAKEKAEKAQKAEEIAKLAAVKAKDEAVKAQKAEELAKVAAVKAKDEAVAARKAEEVAKVAAVKARDEAIKAKEAEEIAKKKAVYQAYIARIGLADSKIRENAFDTAKSILEECPEDLRDWEWGRLMHLCSLSKSYKSNVRIAALAMSPDGTRFATSGFGGKATVWSRNGTGQFELVHDGDKVNSIAWSPDGKWIATGSNDQKNGYIQLWDAQTGQRVARSFAGHTDEVLSVEFSPTADAGKPLQLLSASSDYSARIWNVSDGKEVAKLVGHTNWVWDATFSRDGKSIATCSEDGTVLVWNTTTLKPSNPFNGHDGKVYCVAFSPNGRLIASGGYDRRVLLWNPSSAKAYDFNKLAQAVGSVVPSESFTALDGHADAIRTITFTQDGEFVVTGSDDNSIMLWGLEFKGDTLQTADLQKTFRGHDGAVRALALADNDSVIVSASLDNRIKQWNIEQYEEIRILRSQVFDGHSDAVLSARFSPKGDRIVTASQDRTARVWLTASGEQLVPLSEGHQFLASRVGYFPDGKSLATAGVDNRLCIWDADSTTEIAQLANTGRSAAFAISSDGKWVVTGGNNATIQLWDASSFKAGSTSKNGTIEVKPVVTLKRHNSDVTALAISPNGAWIVSGDASGRCLLWNAKTRKLQFQLDGHSRRITDAVFTGDNKRVLIASADKTVGQWNVSDGNEIRSLNLSHPASVTSIALRPVGNQLVTGCADGTVRVWNIDTAQVVSTLELETQNLNAVAVSKNGQLGLAVIADEQDQKVALWSLNDTGEVKPSKILKIDTPLWAATFTPDNQGILTVGGDQATVINLEGVATRSFAPHGVVAAANFSTDGKLVVTGSWDKTARIWDASTGKVIRKLTSANGHDGYVLSAVFSPDAESKYVLTSGDDGKFIVWDRATGKIVRRVFAHVNQQTKAAFRVNHATFSPNGSWILTCAGDNTARIWNASTGKLVRVLDGHLLPVLFGAFSPNGNWIITGSEDRSARVWDTATGQLLCELKGHTGNVNCVAFAPNTKTRAVTASQDGSVKVWDLNQPSSGANLVADSDKPELAAGNDPKDEVEKKATLPMIESTEILTLDGHTRGVTSVVFSPNGQYLLTASQDGSAILWLSAPWSSDEKVAASASVE